MADARQEALWAAREHAAKHGRPTPDDATIDAALDCYTRLTRQAVHGIAYGVVEAVFGWLWPHDRRALIAYLQQMYGAADDVQAVHIPRHGEPE